MTDDISRMFKLFAVFTESGSPFLKTLEIAVGRTEDTDLKDALKNISTQMQDGKWFSAACSEYTQYFSPADLILLHQTDVAGDFITTFHELAKPWAVQARAGTVDMDAGLELFVRFVEAGLRLRVSVREILQTSEQLLEGELKQSMAQFRKMYEEGAEELPESLPVLFRDLWSAGTYSGGLDFLFTCLVEGLDKGIPLFKEGLDIRQQTIRFLYLMGTVLQCGIAVIPGFSYLKEAAANEEIRDFTEKCIEECGNGSDVFRIMEEYEEVFPQSLVDYIELRETSGDLGEGIQQGAVYLHEGVFR